ncbi:MAG: hypothetical protein LUH11_01800 [Candidatus Gastranaerophilales bacterium]|nr:hypothetical protein [Candidatus Gastranaerophilales bacterium]
MSLNSISTDYLSWTASSGNSVGNGGSVDLTYEDGILTFTEADGDVYTVESDGLTDAEFLSLAQTSGATLNGEAVEEEDDDDSTNQEKLDELKEQFDSLRDNTAAPLKEAIEELSEDIKEALDEALEKQEEITKDEQERIEELVATQIEQFKTDKENGKNVTLTDLQSSISDGMSQGGFDAEMSVVVSDLVVTNKKMVEMDTLLTELGVVNEQLKTLDDEISALQEIVDSETESTCCDPIGFSDESGVTYEFVVDKDGNGELSNFSEFLGSENFFDEMAALDTNGSGNVDNEELNDANVMVLVTDANGNQTLQSVEEAFDGQDVSVNLASYTEAQDGATAANGQTLLGNFDISIGDSTYEGYSTLDTSDYLLSNYTFTDEDPEAASAAEDADEEAASRAADIDEINEFIEEYQAKLEAYEEQYDLATEIIGLDEEVVATLKELSQSEGETEAQEIIAAAAAQEAEEAEEEEAEEEEAEAA